MGNRDFSVSRVAGSLFRTADVEPARVNAVIERRIARGEDAWLRPGHHYTSLTRRVTGVPLRRVSRRNRHLLIEIENREPFWRYLEAGRKMCYLLVPHHFPETIAINMVGRPLRDFTGADTLLGHCVVLSVGIDGNLTSIHVNPGWTKYGGSADA